MSGTISPRDRLQLWVNTFLLKQKENSGSVTATFHEKLKMREEVEPLDTGGDTHKQPIPAQVCRTLKVELCTESANIGAAKKLIAT